MRNIVGRGACGLFTVRRQVTAFAAAMAIIVTVGSVVLAQEAGPPAAPPSDPAPPTPGAAVGPAKGPVDQVVKELRQGPLLIHGNYCGIGNRPGKPPIDALDAACMRHDACTATGALPSCRCDDRLRAEATAVANDPTTPADVKTIAAATAASMAVLVCKITPAE